MEVAFPATVSGACDDSCSGNCVTKAGRVCGKKDERKSRNMPKEDTVIHIDKKKYKVTAEALTGAALRALPDPDISDRYDLVLQVPGDDDRPIADEELVHLMNGMHLFSVPKNLDAGHR